MGAPVGAKLYPSTLSCYPARHQSTHGTDHHSCHRAIPPYIRANISPRRVRSPQLGPFEEGSGAFIDASSPFLLEYPALGRNQSGDDLAAYQPLATANSLGRTRDLEFTGSISIVICFSSGFALSTDPMESRCAGYIKREINTLPPCNPN